MAFSKQLETCRGTFLLGEHPVSMTVENLRKASSRSVGRTIRAAALVDAGFSASSLSGTGWRLVSHFNDVVTIEGNEHGVPFLRAIPGIRLVEFRNHLRPCMDSVRRETHINELQGTVTTVLTKSFTGAGVLFGILDNEFDTHEPAFLDSLGHTRFIALWDQSVPSSSPPNRFGYGRIEKGIDLDRDTLFGSDSNEYHGTHMASCAAGSDKNYPIYRAAASDAKIIAVKYSSSTGSTADFMNGLAWLFSVADSMGLPCVVNMSIGLAEGPHDGTSLMDQRIDSLAAKGHIITGAAGNDGTFDEHVAFSLGARESKGTWVEPAVTQNAAQQSNGFCLIDLWGEVGKAFIDTVYILDRSDMTYQKSGNALSTSTLPFQYVRDTLRWPNSLTGPDTLMLEAVVERASATNRKPHIEIAMYSTNSNLIMGAKVFSTQATTIHGWNVDKLNCFSLGVPGFIDGDSSMTINEVGGTSKSIIAVGGYNSKVTALRYDGTVYGAGDSTLYNYLSYTSLGPTADGRIKPDISAPGREVTGAMTRYIIDKGGRTAVWPNPPSMIGRYAFLGGTSISSPIVAGIIACMLENNPKLTPKTVDSILQKSAIKDRFTGQISSPDVRWGAGKVDAEGAMALLGVPTKAAYTQIQTVSARVFARVKEKNRLIVSWRTARDFPVVTGSLFDMGGRQLWAGVITNGRSVPLPMQLKSGCYFLRVRFGSDAIVSRPIMQLP
jgi:subtilisin family serine protease